MRRSLQMLTSSHQMLQALLMMSTPRLCPPPSLQAWQRTSTPSKQGPTQVTCTVRRRTIATCAVSTPCYS